MKKLKPYPGLVCRQCALAAVKKARIKLSAGLLSTFHYGICDVCEKMASVTDVRDYGRPPFEGHKRY